MSKEELVLFMAAQLNTINEDIVIDGVDQENKLSISEYTMAWIFRNGEGFRKEWDIKHGRGLCALNE